MGLEYLARCHELCFSLCIVSVIFVSCVSLSVFWECPFNIWTFKEKLIINHKIDFTWEERDLEHNQ